jgi:dephospho-CoA kinase
MEYNKEIKIVAFVGLPGSGKSVATEYATAMGYPKVYLGDIFYSEMDKAGLEHTPENEKAFRVEIRKSLGPDFAAKPIIQEIHNLIDAGQHRIVMDGLYSWDEYKTMKHEFPGELIVIAIVTTKHLRHHRLSIRADRPLSEAESIARDWDEIEDINKGGPIAVADYYITNNDSIEKLHEQINKVLKEIEFIS